MSKTAYVFSGIDGLDRMSDRALMLSLPAVKARIAQAQKVLDKCAPGFDLTAYISSSDEDFKRVFTLQAIAVTVVHIALFDMFTASGEKPDYLMGCSLGDVARSYCAGALEFDVIIAASWNYHLKASKIEGCSAYYIRVIDGTISKERIQEITDAGIYFAVHQTPRHFLVTGTIEKLEQWRLSEAPKARYKISPIYDKPLHSPLMTFITEETYKLYAHTVRPMEELKYKMVSSTFIGLIETREQLLKDMVDNFNSTVRWMEALQYAVNELGVTRLVNIGPVPTLLLFAERTPLNHPVEMVNYLAVTPKPATEERAPTFIPAPAVY